MLKLQNNKVIGKYAVYEVIDKCIKVNGRYFNNMFEVQKYRFYRKSNKLSSWDNITNEMIEIFKKYIN